MDRLTHEKVILRERKNVQNRKILSLERLSKTMFYILRTFVRAQKSPFCEKIYLFLMFEAHTWVIASSKARC